MEYEDTPEPEWNKATQKLDGPLFTVVDGVLTKSFNVRDKTQEELDAELEGTKSKQLLRINRKWQEHLEGSVDVSLGFPMQFNQKDIWAVRNVIEFAETMGQETIYLTDSDNINHEGISLSDAKIILLEMGQAHLAAHQKKQALRELVNDAKTTEEVQTISWETGV
jgi:hypothetical protein